MEISCPFSREEEVRLFLEDAGDKIDERFAPLDTATSFDFVNNKLIIEIRTCGPQDEGKLNSLQQDRRIVLDRNPVNQAGWTIITITSDIPPQIVRMRQCIMGISDLHFVLPEIVDQVKSALL